MKPVPFILFLFLLCSCNNQNEEEKYYRAVSFDKKDTAYLKLSEFDNQFYGKHLIRYADKTYDLGDVSGEIIGDTLKGRFKYISRRNSKFTKPFAVLKTKNGLKLGNGMVSYYAQIPFYANGSIQFPDSLFYFTPINKNEISNSNEKLYFQN
ncbi:hypothetical protein [Flavobacterium sp. I3-2]|uniref:hypothetical protein n=1 Tax=Flavobacterium sp. I3-2 TaxID=2748319 RepID=UPI0015B02133|nr:hypothetical protein [Flavobacterium sp. I3-2]